MAQTAVVIPSRSAPQIQWRAHLILLVGLIVGASASILIRMAQNEGVPTLLIVASRLTLSALIITPIAWQRSAKELRSIDLKIAFYTTVAGIWLALHFITFMNALEHTTVLVVNVLAGSSPLFVALLEVFVLRAKLPKIVWLGLFVAIGGSILIALGSGGEGLGDNPALGILLSLSGAVTSALYLIAGRKVRRQISTLPYIWLLFSTAAVTSLIALLLTRTPITGHSAEGYFWVLMVTLLPQLIGHSAFSYVLAYLPATFISISTQLSIALAALVAAHIFNENVSLEQIIGSIAILAGVIIVTLSRSQPPKAPIE